MPLSPLRAQRLSDANLPLLQRLVASLLFAGGLPT